jgi:UDP-N-acetylglucosamine 2-epimerase (non-hydrolysing)
VTLTHGTNTLMGEDPMEIARVRPSNRPPTPCAIPLWDGHAAERVADVLLCRYADADRAEVAA